MSVDPFGKETPVTRRGDLNRWAEAIDVRWSWTEVVALR